MPESSHPTLAEIALVLSHLADRVAADPGPGLDPIVLTSLRRAVSELERKIPGLEPAPDAHAARFLASSSAAALHHARERAALARALRGLAYAPQDPELHYLAGCACFELGAPREAVALIRHALWVHPGYTRARMDLEVLGAYADEPVPTQPDAAAHAPDQGGVQLRFELLDEIPPENDEGDPRYTGPGPDWNGGIDGEPDDGSWPDEDGGDRAA